MTKNDEDLAGTCTDPRGGTDAQPDERAEQDNS